MHSRKQAIRRLELATNSRRNDLRRAFNIHLENILVGGGKRSRKTEESNHREAKKTKIASDSSKDNYLEVLKKRTMRDLLVSTVNRGYCLISMFPRVSYEVCLCVGD